MKVRLSIFCLLFSQILFSQNYVHQVFILNEGHFDYTSNQIIEPVTIGKYNPTTGVYITVDTILGARFASDLVVYGDCFYVAADNMIYKYDKNTYELIASQQVDGVRNLAIFNEKILVTRGDYNNTTFSPVFFNSYLQIFNTSDLSFYLELDTLNGPKWATQDLIIDHENSYMYVAINNAYDWGNEKGIIGVLDLNTFSYLHEIHLGLNGKNPDNMMREGDYIYTINNKDWSGSSISKVNLLTNSSQTIDLSSVPTGCGTSCMRDGKINYQISGDTLVYEWDLQILTSNGNSIGLHQNFYDLAYDNINDLLYASTTDYSTYGTINIYNHNNILVNSFQCGISPGKISFDIRNITNINEKFIQNIGDDITYNIKGQGIYHLSSLSPGIYIKNGQKIYIFQE